MNLEKLKPWNWFKHEDSTNAVNRQVPVTREQGGTAGDSLMRLHQEMDRWFDEISASFGLPSASRRPFGSESSAASLANFYRPQIDVGADSNSYEIKLDVPGIDESDLSIEVRDDVLMIRGEKQDRNESKDKHYYRVERSYGAFQRTLALPDDANADKISARLDRGVLCLQIPRRKGVEQDSRRIEISSS